jgi:hypothetical protein
MIHALTVTMDLQTIDPNVPGKLLGVPLTPGATRGVPGGVIVFQAAFLTSVVGEPSMYRFILQAGARQALSALGNWLFSQLRGTAAALQIGGRIVPIDHHQILTALQQSS